IESLAAEANIHTELARRLIGLGLLVPSGGTRAAPTFERQDALLLSRAVRLGHTEVDTAHLLLALLEQPEGLVPRLLARADVDTGALRAAVQGALERRPRGSGPGAGAGQLGITRALGQLLDAAEG